MIWLLVLFISTFIIMLLRTIPQRQFGKGCPRYWLVYEGGTHDVPNADRTLPPGAVVIGLCFPVLTWKPPTHADPWCDELRLPWVAEYIHRGGFIPQRILLFAEPVKPSALRSRELRVYWEDAEDREWGVDHYRSSVRRAA